MFTAKADNKIVKHVIYYYSHLLVGSAVIVDTCKKCRRKSNNCKLQWLSKTNSAAHSIWYFAAASRRNGATRRRRHPNRLWQIERQMAAAGWGVRFVCKMFSLYCTSQIFSFTVTLLSRHLTFYRPQRSWRVSFCSQEGVCVADTPTGQTPPPLQRHPRVDTPCPVHAGIHTPPAHCMLGYTPPTGCMLGYILTLPSACWDTHPSHTTPPPPRRPLQRTERILLECILVYC